MRSPWISLTGARISALAVTLLLMCAGPGQAATMCRSELTIGHSIYLGGYNEEDIRCQNPSFDAAGGLRYTDQRGDVHPFGLLTYRVYLAPEWSLIPSLSYYERSGDYEIDRLPEVRFVWTPAWSSFVTPTIDLTAGFYTLHAPFMQTTRTGETLSLTTPSIKTGFGEWSFSTTGGMYNYGTGQSLTFWTGVAAWTVHLSPTTYATLTYQQQNGWGATPLLFDNVYYDQLLTGTIIAPINKTDLISVSATMNLQIQPGTLRTVTAAWLRGQGQAFTITWQQVDGHLSVGVVWPLN